MSWSWSSRPRVAAVALALGLLVCGAPPARARQEAPPPADAPTAREGLPRVDANESFLRWGARASGPIGLVILGMSFYLIALVAWMAFEYRRAVALPEPLIREVTELVAAKKYTEGYQRLMLDTSLLARVLSAGVRKLPAGLPAAQRAMEMANEDATMAMEHRTTYLATVGTLGPMIGLLGTVYGMILSFRVIAVAGSSPQASELARGIATALFATLEGIGLSVPAIACYALFRNRIARLSLEVEMEAESLLEQFAAGVRLPHPLATAAAAPTRSALPPKAEG